MGYTVVCWSAHESQRGIHTQALVTHDNETIKVEKILSLILLYPRSSHPTYMCFFNSVIQGVISMTDLSLLVDPAELGGLPGDNLTLLEPESNLLLGVLDGVGTVADVAADVDGKVTTDGTGRRGKGVGGTEDGWKCC